MSLRQDSNLHDHSWSRDFPTTLAFTQANLNKGIRTLNPQEIFNDDFRDAFRQSAAVYQFRHI